MAPHHNCLDLDGSIACRSDQDCSGAAAVCDVVYNPFETPLLKQARALGLKTVDGLGMLMHQAVPAFKAFYGVAPKVTPELRRALEEALRE